MQSLNTETSISKCYMVIVLTCNIQSMRCCKLIFTIKITVLKDKKTKKNLKGTSLKTLILLPLIRFHETIEEYDYTEGKSLESSLC